MGRRVFIATAGHVITDNPNANLVLFGRKDTVESVFLKWDRIYGDGVDLGYLEIAEDTLQRLGNEAVPLKSTVSHHAAEMDDLVLVAGVPADSVLQETGQILVPTPSTNQFQRVLYVRPRHHPFVTWLIPTGEWPGRLAAPVPETGLHLLLRYHRDTITLLETGHRSDGPPDGYSGGGVWLVGKEDPRCRDPKLVFHPTEARLIGVQVGWYEEARVSKAMRFGNWLEFAAPSS